MPKDLPKEAKMAYRCDKCDRGFTSMMRLQHHRAAEHAPKTMHDIRKLQDLRTR